MATNKLYERVAKQLAAQIDQGLYRPGDRLPGVRRLAQQFEVRISTIVQAQRLRADGQFQQSSGQHYASGQKTNPRDTAGEA